MRRSAIFLALALCLSACGPRWTKAQEAQAVAAPGAQPGAADTSAAQPGAAAAAGGSSAAGTAPGAAASAGQAASASRTAAPGAAAGQAVAAVDSGPKPGVSNTEISVCYLVPLTGAAPVPTTWDKGANLYWDTLKKKAGINGRNVKLTVKDTESDTATALARARECINEKAFTFVTLDRFEVEAVVGKFLNSQKIPNILVQSPPSASGPDQVNTFVVTIDHVAQGKLIADYFTTGDLKGKKYAVVRENVADLVPGADAFKNEIKVRGGQVVADETIDGQGNDFSSTVLKLSGAGAQVVWVYAAPTPMVKLAQQSQAAGFHPTWFANSISWAFDTAAQVGNASGALAGARAFSSWVSVSSPAAAPYKAAYKEQYPNDVPDDIGLVGWGIGEVLGAALQGAGRDLGYNTFRAAFQSLNITPQTWTPEQFGAGGRVGARSIIEFRIAGDHWEQTGAFRSSF